VSSSGELNRRSTSIDFRTQFREIGDLPQSLTKLIGRLASLIHTLTHPFLPRVQSSKMRTVTKGFDARLAKRQFLVFDFRALYGAQP